MVRALLGDEPLSVRAPDVAGDNDDEGNFWSATEWWIDIMRRPEAGIHERMAWFWHGHLTSGLDKSSPSNMLVQLQLLRTHALGNFRILLHAITLDPAMLLWLDGAESDAAAPNENYARELMELFALGRHSGAYTEADVRAGAKALAGHFVEGENDRDVVLEPDLALNRPVEFLGARVKTAADVVDAVCDHPMCARFIAGKVHEYFLGTPPSDERLDALARIFAGADLEIAPLVEEILTHPSFHEQPLSRPRSALEWFLALERLLGTRLETWVLESLGQVPLNPPNVAGWPNLERWVSGGALFTKSEVSFDYSRDSPTLDSGDPVSEVVARAGLVTATDSTRSVLDDIVSGVGGRREISALLHAAMAMSPEFSLT